MGAIFSGSRDDDVAAGFQLAVDLLGQGGVGRRLRGQQDGFAAFGEGRIHVHRQADHAQIILQELLARLVVDLVGMDADGVAELAHQFVGLAQDDIRDPGHRGRRHGLLSFLERGCHLVIAPARALVLPGGAEHRVQLDVHELVVGEQHHVPALRDGREEELLRIAVHAHGDAAGIHPAPAIAAARDILEIPHNVVAEVVLQVLVPCRVAGLRAGPDAVEDLRPPFEVEAEALEVVIPVRVLDDDLDLRVDGLRGADDQVAAGLVHPLQAVFGPAPVPLGGDFHVLLAAGEEEVVQEELVEMPGRRLGHFLHPFPVLRVRVAEGFEIVRFADGVGDAAGDLDVRNRSVR